LVPTVDGNARTAPTQHDTTTIIPNLINEAKLLLLPTAALVVALLHSLVRA